MWLLKALYADYGFPYVTSLLFFFLFVKGFSSSLVKALALPYFQEVQHVDLLKYHEIYTFVFLMPWCLKPLFGIISDLFPLFGYRKRNYIRLNMTACTVTAILISLKDNSVKNAVIYMSIFMISIVFSDLLMEASYSENLRDYSKLSGNSLVTLAWAMVIIGYGASALTAGVVADAGYAKDCFIVASVPTCVYCLFGTQYIPEPKSRVSSEKINRYTGHIMLSFAMSAGALIIGVLVFYGNLNHIAPVTLLLCLGIGYLSKKVLSPTVFSCNLYMFIAEATYVNFVGATDYFYTAGCKNSPNFDFTFYTTYSMLLSACFAAVGLCLFTYIQHYSIKTLFASLTIARVVAASAEVLQAARWNTENGIDDKTFFLLGEAVVQPAVSMLFAIPMILLTTRLVERGSEAISYALLAGTQNLGCMVGSIGGQIASDIYKLQGCNYDLLPQALVMGHMALPLLCVPLAYFMLPDTCLKKQSLSGNRIARVQ